MSEKSISPAASNNYISLFCIYLILVTQCYCMLRQDIQVSYCHLLQLHSLVYHRSSHCKFLRAQLWTLHHPISIPLHNIMLPLFLLLQGRRTSVSFSLLMDPCFDWQEQSALVSMTFTSTDLSLTADMLVDIVSPSTFTQTNSSLHTTNSSNWRGTTGKWKEMRNKMFIAAVGLGFGWFGFGFYFS